MNYELVNVMFYLKFPTWNQCDIVAFREKKKIYKNQFSVSPFRRFPHFFHWFSFTHTNRTRMIYSWFYQCGLLVILFLFVHHFIYHSVCLFRSPPRYSIQFRFFVFPGLYHVRVGKTLTYIRVHAHYLLYNLYLYITLYKIQYIFPKNVIYQMGKQENNELKVIMDSHNKHNYFMWFLLMTMNYIWIFMRKLWVRCECMLIVHL